MPPPLLQNIQQRGIKSLSIWKYCIWSCLTCFCEENVSVRTTSQCTSPPRWAILKVWWNLTSERLYTTCVSVSRRIPTQILRRVGVPLALCVGSVVPLRGSADTSELGHALLSVQLVFFILPQILKNQVKKVVSLLKILNIWATMVDPRLAVPRTSHKLNFGPLY